MIQIDIVMPQECGKCRFHVHIRDTDDSVMDCICTALGQSIDKKYAEEGKCQMCPLREMDAGK